MKTFNMTFTLNTLFIFIEEVESNYFSWLVAEIDLRPPTCKTHSLLNDLLASSQHILKIIYNMAYLTMGLMYSFWNLSIFGKNPTSKWLSSYNLTILSFQIYSFTQSMITDCLRGINNKEHA